MTPRMRHLAAPEERTVAIGGLGAAASRIVPIALPALFLGGYIIWATLHLKSVNAYFDFHTFWGAGRAVLQGRSPYPPPSAAVLAHEKSFVYPAPAAIAMVPFALLPFKAAAAIFASLLVVSIPVSLRIIGVRDWRCYCLALMSDPVANSIAVAAVSPLLMLGLAIAWRYRDRRGVAAAAVAALVVLKVFLWPLLVWFALTRRFRTGVLAGGIVVVSSFLAWAAIGFDGLRTYPHVLEILTRLVEGKGFSLVALGLSGGLDPSLARTLPWLVGVLAVVAVALRGRGTEADAWTFIVAIGVALALSPIVWPHYLVLLFVAIGIAQPRFSWLWALPLALWILRGQSIQPPMWRPAGKVTDLADTARIGHLWLIAYAVAIATATLVLAGRKAAANPSPTA